MQKGYVLYEHEPYCRYLYCSCCDCPSVINVLETSCRKAFTATLKKEKRGKRERNDKIMKVMMLLLIGLNNEESCVNCGIVDN